MLVHYSRALSTPDTKNLTCISGEPSYAVQSYQILMGLVRMP